MENKYELQHVGHPQAIVNADDWKHLSYHHTLIAAVKRYKALTKDFSSGWWTDHYRIIEPSGNEIPYDEAVHKSVRLCAMCGGEITEYRYQVGAGYCKDCERIWYR